MFRQLRIAFCLLVAASILASCHGQKPDEHPTPDRSGDAIYKMATHVSEQVDLVVIVPRIDTFIEQLEAQAAFDPIESDAPPEAVGRILAGSLGFDPRDPRAWRSKGIDTAGPMILAFYTDDPVVLMPIADSEQFEGFIEDQSWSYEERSSRSRAPYLNRARANSNEDIERVPTWQLRDGVACISVESDRRDADRVCRRDDAFAAGSLAQSPEFLSFRDGDLRDADLGIFAPTFNAATVEGVAHGLLRLRSLDPGLVMAAISKAEGFGFTASFAGNGIDMRARLSLSEEGHAALDQLFSVPNAFPMNGRVGPETVAALRLAVDPDTAWSWFTRVLHPHARSNAQKGLERVDEALGEDFDLRAEIIEQLSGEALMLVQRLPMKVPGSGASNAHRRRNHGVLVEEGMGFVFVFRFKDPVAPPRLLDVLQRLGTDGKMAPTNTLTTKQGPAGTEFDVTEFDDSRLPYFYASDHYLVIAPTQLPVAEVEAMLLGTHPSVESSGARAFLNSQGAAAGFIDFQALFDALGRDEARKNLEDLANKLRHVEASLRLEPDALEAEGRFEQSDVIRLFTDVVIRRQLRDWTYRPQSNLRRFAHKISRYYEHPQQGCPDPERCDEPWHRSGGGTIPEESKSFPGGPDVTVTSHRAPPTAGRSQPAELGGGPHAERVAEIIGLNQVDDSHFQYVYKTNNKTGPGASFTLEAIADLDPTTPEKHTYVIQGVVSTTGALVVTKVGQEHRFE